MIESLETALQLHFDFQIVNLSVPSSLGIFIRIDNVHGIRVFEGD
jgi:hypothetical protein